MEHIQLVIKDYQLDNVGLGNIMKCFITSLSINEDTVIECYPEYMYGAYDTILDPRFICKDTHKRREKVYTCRLLLLRREEAHQQNIPSDETFFNGLSNPLFNWYWSFTHQIDWNYDPTKIHPVVRDRIFEAMSRIIFLPIILDEVRLFLSGITTPFLGVSVRTWKASHEHNIKRPYDATIYKNSIQEIQDMNHNISIVLSIDNEEYIEPYMSLSQLHIIRKPEHFNALQFALYKMLVLSHSSHFIGHRISTFTELVFWFSRHKTVVHPLF